MIKKLAIWKTNNSHNRETGLIKLQNIFYSFGIDSFELTEIEFYVDTENYKFYENNLDIL